jgi:hypothetical protein
VLKVMLAVAGGSGGTGGQGAGYMLRVTLADTGPPGPGQAFPQLLVAGQLIIKVTQTGTVAPPADNTAVPTGMDFASTIVLVQAVGLIRQTIGPVPEHVRPGRGVKSAAMQKPATTARLSPLNRVPCFILCSMLIRHCTRGRLASNSSLVLSS